MAWLAFQPGYMNFDSLLQYEMSLTREFSDWHPPIMSALWVLLGSQWTGPGGMLVFQLALVWGGVLLWMARLDWRPAAACLLLLPLLPWVINFQGVLWKDVGMAYALLMLSALLLAPPSRWRWAAAVLLVFYALNLRHNALLAVGPLVFLMFRLQPAQPSILRASLYTAFLLVACLAGGQLLSQGVLKAEKTAASGYLMMDDLAWLSLHADRSLIPGKTLLEIQRCAATDMGANRLVGRVLCLYEPAEVLEELAALPELPTVWRNEIAAEPWAYLRYRMASFGYLLRSPASQPYFIWQPGIEANSLGLSAPPNTWSQALQHYVHAASRALPLLFKPYGWLLLSAIGALAGLALERSPVQRCAQTLFVSAGLYIGGYALTTPMADFRYVYWSALACTLAWMLLLADPPGWREPAHRGKLAGLLAAALACVLLIPSWERLTALDTDALLRTSLASSTTRLPLQVQGRHDLAAEGEWLTITGPDPFLALSPVRPQSDAGTPQFMVFTLECRQMPAPPVLQIFLWGGEIGGADETYSQRMDGRQGQNILGLSPTLRSPAIQPLTGIRLDIDHANGCTEFKIKDAALLLG